LTEKLLRTYKFNLTGLELIPSSGGVFEVLFNGQPLYSKKKLGRFPEEDEVIELVREQLAR